MRLSPKSNSAFSNVSFLRQNATLAVVTALAASVSLVVGGCSSDDSKAASGGASSSGGSASTGGSGASTGGSGASTGGSGNQSGSTGRVGNFQVLLADAIAELGSPANTSLVGYVYDHQPPPSDVVLKLDREQGGCQLLVPANPFCEPDCDADHVCTADSKCSPRAVAQSVGVVHVTGLQPVDFTMDPAPPGFAYQPSGDVHLAYPPCTEGADVKLEADGFSISGKCISPLVLDGSGSISVKSGQALHLTWTAPGQSNISRVSIHIDLAHHGGKKGEIDCDVADTGSFDIPEPLVTRLVGLGLAGFPTVDVSRNSVATAAAEPGIKLTITSTTSRPLDTGVVSCGDTLPCPSGMSCAADRTCK
jgi:hypothetical protein